MTKKKTKTKTLKNPKWELFCRHYTSNEELFGNATHAYAEAFKFNLDSLSHDDAVYDEDREENDKGELVFSNKKIITPSSYDKAVNTCAVNGHALLRNTKINQRIIELLNDIMRDEVVDAQLAKVIMQDDDRPSKVSAIKEYNNLKSRTKKRLELTGPNGVPLFDEDTKTKSKKAVQDFLTRGNTGARK